MPPAVDDDGSEDVSDFLKRIKELGDQRDREDEERNRKLEEEIKQGRKEREARRAERARSLSPSKGDVRSPPSSAHGSRDLNVRLTPALSAQQEPDEMNKAVQKTSTGTEDGQKDAPQRDPMTEKRPVKTDMVIPPSRLSWQQRPPGTIGSSPRDQAVSTSNGSGPGGNLPLKPTTSKTAENPETSSKHQILQSLESKDPAWFRQTEDRGSSSAAFRKNRDDSAPENSTWTASVRLPGMGDAKQGDVQEQQVRTSSPDRLSSISRDNSICSPGSSAQLMRSPIPSLSSQKFDEPSSDTTASLGGTAASNTSRGLAMSPSQGRLSPERMERPSSPTKGLGGFVQSAMMKRSDSVNKRWSATVNPGLSRSNSIVTNPIQRYPVGEAKPLSGAKPLSRDSTPAPTGRPISSHGKDSAQLQKENNPLKNTSTASPKIGPPINEKLSVKVPSSPEPEEPTKSLPSSPSKRWSPSKSSWLENAISKPEASKVISPAVTQQPAWMSNLNRARQERGSVDLSRGPGFKEVTTAGLMRSPTLGSPVKSSSLGNLSLNTPFSPPELSQSQGTKSLADPRDIGSDQALTKTDQAARATPPPKPAKPSLAHSPSIRQNGSHNAGPDPERSVQRAEGSDKGAHDVSPKQHSRAGLKAKARDEENAATPEPEFKNVFGKLKKTHTQNYKAPDELKDNITRGKAGLSITGGPQKSQIREDFKESILKKKQGMLAPSASTRISNTGVKSADSTVPEAIARRQGLIRSNSKFDNRPSEDKGATPTASRAPKTNSFIARDEPPPTKAQKPLPERGISGPNFASSLANVLQRGPPPAKSIAEAGPQGLGIQSSHEPQTSRQTEPAGSGSAQLTHATKSRARGPKRKPPGTKDAAASVTGPPPPSTSVVVEKPLIYVADSLAEPSKSPRKGDGITSVTSPIAAVNGSRGPSSQPPTPRKSSASVALQMNASSSQSQQDVPSKDAIKTPPMNSHTVVTKPTETSKLPLHQPTCTTQDTKVDRSIDSLPKLSPLSTSPRHPGRADYGLSDRPAALPIQSNSPKSPPLPAKKPLQPVSASRPNEQPPTSVPHKSFAASENRTPSKPPLDREIAQPVSNPPIKSPPLLGKKPVSIPSKVSGGNSATSDRGTPRASPTKSPSAVETCYEDIFDEAPKASASIKIDTQALLEARANTGLNARIKTLRKQIFEVGENGKQIAVPAQEEHILFEESIYLCVHVFGTPAGTKTTEVYLWHGQEAPQSAVEDAQLFGKRVAREQNGRLILIAQGKESYNFFQALGGIVIIRKGSSNRHEGHPYLLCGRQHLGHIAFDELSLDPSQLCHGFPYIIRAPNGKLTLWKGKGAKADELGCARLIGMDVGVNGEIEEVEDGQETDAFWGLFAISRRTSNMKTAETIAWDLKAGSEKYATSLFTIDVEVPRRKSATAFMSWGRRGSAPANDATSAMTAQVLEVTPFTQSDLVEDAIFLLDTFFELHIIHVVRTLSPAPQHRSTKSSALRAALVLAQEYGILAASAEDRPFVPKAYLTFLSREAEAHSSSSGKVTGTEEALLPEGIRWAFRQWDDRAFRRCRVFDLQDALEGCS